MSSSSRDVGQRTRVSRVATIGYAAELHVLGDPTELSRTQKDLRGRLSGPAKLIAGEVVVELIANSNRRPAWLLPAITWSARR